MQANAFGNGQANVVQDVASRRDQSIYSSVVLSDGGTGITTCFSGTKGQAIPLKGTATAATHQKTYDKNTTNIVQSGQPGSGIGNLGVLALGVTYEQCVVPTSSTTYGANAQDVGEMNSKLALELKIAGNSFDVGPAWMFPSLGGTSGFVASTATNVTESIAQNGNGSRARAYSVPVLIGQSQSIEAEFSITGTLTFSQAGGDPTLVWVMMPAITLKEVVA
ncbi:MAG TPA: hypothetical protein VMW52_07295 [Phycisphaerae bacterium]|nr:hypothetical protein [Phycisphaerae bacterium]